MIGFYINVKNNDTAWVARWWRSREFRISCLHLSNKEKLKPKDSELQEPGRKRDKVPKKDSLIGACLRTEENKNGPGHGDTEGKEPPLQRDKKKEKQGLGNLRTVPGREKKAWPGTERGIVSSYL